MDMIAKIVTLLGGMIGIAAAIGILLGVKDIRSGMSNDDSRTLDKGIEKVVVGGVTAIALGGIVAYILAQVNAVSF